MTDASPQPPVLSFPDAAAWDAWVEAQPPGSPGVWLKLAKKAAGVPSVSKAEAIDVALCRGWIDGQLAPFDDHWWLIRFTPRRPRSKWSEVNRTRALELIAARRMTPAGQAEIDRARADGRWDAAYAPQSRMEVPPDLQAALEAEPRAAAFFATLKGANRYAVLYRIADAKRPETRARRIRDFVAMLAEGRTIHG
jgi:uncharacterized protein YdeI (YjbR/CyaY-like superfamily)